MDARAPFPICFVQLGFALFCFLPGRGFKPRASLMLSILPIEPHSHHLMTSLSSDLRPRAFCTQELQELFNQRFFFFFFFLVALGSKDILRLPNLVKSFCPWLHLLCHFLLPGFFISSMPVSNPLCPASTLTTRSFDAQSPGREEKV